MINNKNNQSQDILNITLASFFYAMFLLFYYFNQIIPTPPPLNNFFVKLPLHYIPLLISTMFLLWRYLLVFFILCSLSLYFIPSIYIINFWTFLLDYSIPIMVTILFKFFNIKNAKNKYILVILQIIGIFIFIFLGYWSKVISGTLYWFKPEIAKNNDTAFTFALWFNSIASSCDFLILCLTIPIITKIINIYSKNT